MEHEKISIIVPVYNIAAWLPRCLQSITAQSYTDLEILLVDDGSPDESGAICDEWAARDSRIRVIHQPNGGVVRARLAGLRAATGQWFGFVDGDDFIEPDMYSRLIANAHKYQADISHCGYQMVFPDRVDYYHNTGCILELDRLSGTEALLDGTRVEPALWNKLYRRELMDALLQSGIEDLGIKINEDLLMNFCLFQAAQRSVYEDFCPYHYIIRSGSAANSRNRECHVTDPIRVGRLLCDQTRQAPRLYIPALRLYVRRLMQGAMQKQFPALAKAARQELRQANRGQLPRKERYMALLVVYAPSVYRAVRWLYNKITRADHKYDLT